MPIRRMSASPATEPTTLPAIVPGELEDEWLTLLVDPRVPAAEVEDVVDVPVAEPTTPPLETELPEVGVGEPTVDVPDVETRAPAAKANVKPLAVPTFWTLL